MRYSWKKNQKDKLTSKAIGNQAEAQAKDFLIKQGLDIIKTNFFCKGGEIDIIARDNDYLVFIEVKYRKQNQYGNPLEMVTAIKQKKLIHAAQHYLLKLNNTPNCRFDVISIEPDKEEVWIKNAFFIN